MDQRKADCAGDFGGHRLPPYVHRPLGRASQLKPVPQLAFEAEIDRWLADEFGWRRDPEEILF